MKDGWKMKKLGEVCLFENGDRGENYPSKSVQTTSGVPFINAGHLTDFGIDYQTLNFIPRERFDLLGNGKIRKNDILFCLRGSLGKFACVGELSEGAIASSLVIVRPCKSVLKSYVLAYFQSDLCAEMISKFKNGAAQPNLSAGNLKEFKIPLPAIPEQQRIVAILDEAFEGIATAKANADKNLKNARQLFESHLNSVFSQRGEGWVEKKLADVYDIRDGTHDSPKYCSTGYPLVTSKNLKREGLSFDNVKLISENDYKKINKRSFVQKGDVLLAMIGTIGNPTLVTIEPNFAIKNVALFKIPDGQNGSFLKHYLNSERVVSKMMNEAKGTTQKFVGLGYLREFPINIPTLSIQLKLVGRLDELSAETGICQQRCRIILKKIIRLYPGSESLHGELSNA